MAWLKKLSDKGWLGAGWPKEYGGMGWSHIETAIFTEEAAYHRVPLKAFDSTFIVGNS
ncbi:MAG: acyl-CoA dehydrogenase family protein, partial [Acidobacteria bacterium]|nr:acyl-CoA dehydrogenase family protein [Acidobacteriota bacterium]